MASNEDYQRAADAVQSGTATARQKKLNHAASRQAGRMGNDARAAAHGKKNW